MTIILNISLTVFLLFSFLGYMALARRVIGLKKEFVPVFAFSFVACIIYFCGLAGMLLAGSIMVMIGGIIAFAVLLVKKSQKGNKVQIPLSLFGFIWIIGILCFFSLLLRSQLTHYDNFSHWGIVVKQMLSTNAFPTAASNLIDFKNYPLGISAFLYYVCRFAGNYQPVMVFAQGLLIFSCFYAIFGIISEKKRFLLYAFLGFGCATLSIFNITIRINNLLVDFLLPIYTLAIFSVGYQYRSDFKRGFLIALPLAGILTVTKSTGIVFALIGLIFLFFITFVHQKTVSRWKILIFALITLGISVSPLLSWNYHMKTSFYEVENKFDLQDRSTEKTKEEIEEITSLFLNSVSDLSTRPAMGIVVFQLIAVLAILFDLFILKKNWSLWKALLALDVVLILYYIGIWGLYIFSMPLDEALWLAGFERYASSIVILFAGGLVLAATVDIEKSFYYKIGQVPDEQAFKNVANKNRYQKGVLLFMAVGVTLLLSEYNGISSIIREYNTTLPYKIRQITGDRWYENGEEDTRRYLFYAPDKDAQVTNFFMQYVGRYYLYAPNVDGICLFYEDNMDNLLSGYDYFIVAESDANERYLLRKHYNVTGEEGIYKIINTDDKVTLILEENGEE